MPSWLPSATSAKRQALRLSPYRFALRPLRLFEMMGLVKRPEIADLLDDCDLLSRKITNFSRSL
jgi:hypothetical protein